MSEEYIPREAAIDSVKAEMKYRNGTLDYNAGLLRATENLEILPAADVAEVRHGRWVHGREVGREYLGDCLVEIFYDRWTCSECGYVVDDHEYSRINYKFCPHCGAKMK